MEEIWKPIPQFPDYQISSLGQIRSSRQIRKLFKNKVGYWFTNIRGVNVYVHSTVCSVFNGPAPIDKLNALHRDDNKDNNTPNNLYWGTMSDNMDDAIRNLKYTRIKTPAYLEWVAAQKINIGDQNIP